MYRSISDKFSITNSTTMGATCFSAQPKGSLAKSRVSGPTPLCASALQRRSRRSGGQGAPALPTPEHHQARA